MLTEANIDHEGVPSRDWEPHARRPVRWARLLLSSGTVSD